MHLNDAYLILCSMMRVTNKIQKFPDLQTGKTIVNLNPWAMFGCDRIKVLFMVDSDRVEVY